MKAYKLIQYTESKLSDLLRQHKAMGMYMNANAINQGTICILVVLCISQSSCVTHSCCVTLSSITFL